MEELYKMASRTLPNGQIIEGIPPSYTNEQLKAYALHNGLATEADYNVDQDTAADYLSLAGEIGGATAGAMYGASLGSAVFPGFGTLAGGAIGAGLGYFLGEVGEAYVEDRDFDAEQAMDESLKAAATDAVFGAGFTILGKGLKAAYKPLANSFQPTLIKGGTDTDAAKAALAIQRGETTLEEIIGNSNLSEEYVDLIRRNLETQADELTARVALQEKLVARGTTMVPSQAVPEYTPANLAQDYTQSSVFLGKMYDDIIEEQDSFIVDSFKNILGESTDKLTRYETGQAIQKLVQDSDKALNAVVTPLYKAIDKDGAINIATGAVKNNTKRTMEAAGMPSSSMKAVQNRVNKINDTLSPAEVTKEMAALRRLGEQIPPTDPTAKKMLNSAIRNLNNTLKGKKFVRPVAAINRGKAALNSLTKKDGTTGLMGLHKKMADKLVSMRSNMSFNEAHLELSTLKAMQRDAVRSVGEKSTKAEKLVNEAIGDLENAMEAAAKNFNPDLKQKYDAVKNIYKEGVQTIHGDWLVKALRKDNVADIGQYLVKGGEAMSVKQVKDLISKAKQLKVDVSGNNILESIEREYLNTLFPANTLNEGLSFMKNMKDNKFADTFAAIVGKDKANKLLEFGKEIEILSKGLKGSEGALSLTVRGQELGAVRDPISVTSLVYPLLATVAKGQMSPANVTKKLNQIKAMNKQLVSGKPITEEKVARVLGLNTQTGLITGAVLVDQEQQ